MQNHKGNTLPGPLSYRMVNSNIYQKKQPSCIKSSNVPRDINYQKSMVQIINS